MRWIPIEERVPPLDVVVLIAEYDSRPKVEMYFVSTAYRLNDRWFEPTHGEEITLKGQVITHWMPLPDPPNRFNTEENRTCSKCNKKILDDLSMISLCVATGVCENICKNCETEGSKS